MDKLSIFRPKPWADYSLIDCGGMEKLERFGNYVLIRPEAQAKWNKKLGDDTWREMAHARFVGKSASTRKWEKYKDIPKDWLVKYENESLNLQLKLKLTEFKHVGVFPEQITNWNTVFKSLKDMNLKTPRFLNLFAYTGGASLAAKAAGADVYHVDSIRQIITWAKGNMEISELKDIRWVLEDAVKFVQREVKRGNRYNGIILDPPAFGHGPKGESWKLDKHINDLLLNVIKLLDKDKHLLILNTYSLGYSSLIIRNILNTHLNTLGLQPDEFSTGELVISSEHGDHLPMGIMARLSKL